MPVYGHLEKFQKDQDWGRYIAVLKNYFGANGITDGVKKRQILLASVGLETYDLICVLVAPLPPEEKTFEELVMIVQDHVRPPPSKIVSRFRFYTLSRKKGESISSFVVKLRQAAQDCKFTDLNEHLKDRFIVAIGDDKIQARLLSLSDHVTFAKALQVAIAMESAQANTEDIQAAAAASSVSGASAVCEVREVHSTKRDQCYGCGGDHYRRDCKFKNAVCHACGRKGHISRVCQATVRNQCQNSPPIKRNNQSKRKSVRSTHLVEQEDTGTISEDSELEYYTICNVSSLKNSAIEVTMEVQSRDLTMQVDTGAAISLISKSTYKMMFSNIPLEKFKKRLTTYTGQVIKVYGCAKVDVKYGDQRVSCLPLVVVEQDGPSLLGRNWLAHIRLDWPNICSVMQDRVDDVLAEYPEVFRCNLGEYKGSPVKLYIEKTAKPRFFKARPVPYAIKKKVQEAIEKNVQLGIWESTDYSDWAAPLVPILKSDGSVRLCGDYKITVNQVCRVDPYPLPRIEDIFAELRGGQSFTKIDLHSAYSQIPIHHEYQEYLTVNTHMGLFKVKRLPFGVNAAVGIFQRIICNVLRGLKGVSVYLDDILVTGKDDREHIHNLENVLISLRDSGLQLKKKKCSFLQQSVDVLSPLYHLTKNDIGWRWGNAEQEAFRRAGDLISTSQVLVHYNPDLPLRLECDASPRGLGAVLSHKFSDGTERPVVFSSRTLTKAESNYSQIDREGLALVFGVIRFHQYIYGRNFTLITNLKPLTYLFGREAASPTMASHRVRRWALTLSAYDYNIQYKKGKDNSNADALSRLPLPDLPRRVHTPEELNLVIRMLNSSQVVSDDAIRRETRREPILSQVLQWVRWGWPGKDPGGVYGPYYIRRYEISLKDGCLLWGSRVIIPEGSRGAMLGLLHDTHIGIIRMKALGRSYVWWPGIDKDIEGTVKACQECDKHQNAPELAELHPWEWPSVPLSRIHVDHAGPFMGKLFLIVVDSHSKWMEVKLVSSTSTNVAIDALNSIFATHGLPVTLVSDNGTAFTSEEFGKYCEKSGIKHIRSAPRHPSTNGLAERAVQTFKSCMKKMEESLPWSVRLNRFLFKYRNTPQSTTQQTPSQLPMNREIWTPLSMIQGDLTTRILRKQEAQCKAHDGRVKTRYYIEGDQVYTHFGGQKFEWVPGTILSATGPLSYIIKLVVGRVVKRHVDHIRSHHTTVIPRPNDDEVVPEPLLNEPPPCFPVEIPPHSPAPRVSVPRVSAPGVTNSPEPSVQVPEMTATANITATPT
ncbi:hypothetical protein Pmani_007945 [Petrolisthes manimaculis]|uniref:RNA-directed DNA polymerase n=1 Tax=Petrolisthes manimaculis TaxID=1843537 RepID=A0AAE1Q7X1_9EUCA|nr:hypothetical protein Pmani_007940 [Petrolisthes manimaculis]KAK4321220.1 hypothetical protein Pmani_007945 [Petrolisthes manimaculis]